MEGPAPLEDMIRRMTPVAAPLEQRAEVGALFRALDTMAHRPKGRAPKCKLVGPKGETIGVPESVFYVLERVDRFARMVPAPFVVVLDANVLFREQAAAPRRPYGESRSLP